MDRKRPRSRAGQNYANRPPSIVGNKGTRALRSMRVGEDLDLIGQMSDRVVIRPRSGSQPFVKGVLLVGDRELVPIVFWDAGRAPRDGTLIQVHGVVRSYGDSQELHALQWVSDQNSLPVHPVANIVRFLRGCVEAEAAGQVRLTQAGRSHLEVKSGPNPLLTGREVPGDKAATAWCRARATNLGETVLAGWPLVIGPEPDATSSAYVAAPLFTCEVRLARTDDRWVIEHVGASVDLNPYALDLMGVARDERDELVRAVEESDAVESVSTNVGRVRAILAGLAESGLDELKSLDPESLKPSVFTKGVHPVAVVMATTGSTQMTRMLLEDLDELIWNPDLVIGTPAEQFLGLKPCSNVTAFQAQPAVVPTTLSQDQAVTSAMSNTLTVVTGPPGTGKSQVIVNLVAAALANNQTVLFASKNNKAVDVVFERLEAVSAGAGAVRAGGTARRNDAATAIAQILSAPRRSVDPVGARNRWNEVARKLDGVYENLRVRARLEGEIESVRVGLEELLAGAPSETRFDIELDNLGTALDEARRAVEAFSARLWIFGRWRKHENRLKAARSALQQLCSEVGQPASTIDHILESVSTRPQRSFEPSARFSGVEQVVELIRSVQKKQVTMSSLIADLAALPPKSAVEDELHSLAAERISASRALVDARWEQSRRDDPASRTAAGELAEQLRNVARTGSGARKARGSIVPALPAIPVWGVTNLSARTNLPLTAGLFDLVVIDEASQCDVASALPLLVRAKRAVVIGDRRQLTHITSLGPGRESRIAEAAGLSEEDAIDFSYRSRSCFGMAATRVDEDPVFLDMHFRSHPAIIGFSNHFFYEDRLKFCSPYSGSTSDPAISWDDVVGPSRAGPGNKSRINEVEAETIIERLREGLPGWRGLSLSVGVVTPYRAQAEHIRKRITEVFDDDTAEQLTVATAHRFQGDERDVILFSTVIDSDMSDRQTAFAGDANLVNVALTRARRRLIVVGNMTACLASKNVLAHLARYVSRLEAGGFDSAIEQHLHEALLARGVVSETGHVVAGHRLDLAVIHPTIRLDIECDGAAFHQDEVRDAARDRVIEEQGWKVVRFSARRLGHDIDRCVDEVIELLG